MTRGPAATAVAPGPAPAPATRRPALERVPLLALGFLALIVGTGAGLARLGWPMPSAIAGAAGWHGPLMVSGFFGTVIGLERAVALGRRWAYAAPLASGAGTLLFLAGAPAAAAWAWAVGSVVLFAATTDVLRRQREAFVVVLALAAACGVVAQARLATGAAVHEFVVWWLGFLVLTIAAERLELSRLRPPSAAALRGFAVLVAAGFAALVATLPVADALAPAGVRAFGLVLLALAAWLWRHDLARRTVRQAGLTRYIAVCLLSGYAWLAVGGAVIAAAGLAPGSRAYDAALHALLLGFVFAMVFGHAPIVFPAVLRVAVPYRPAFYAPLVLLHASVAIRLGGLALDDATLRRGGALLSALALAAFIATTIAAVVAGRRRTVAARR